ncbi:hypothetical protein FKM82_024903 [Ascaphus truei]
MAASLGIMSRLWVAGIRGAIWGKVPVTPLRSLCTQSDPFDTASRYKDQPWEYLASEEYLERYGQAAVWVGYRRNHKGAIPPQKTRKTCIVSDQGVNEAADLWLGRGERGADTLRVSGGERVNAGETVGKG